MEAQSVWQRGLWPRWLGWLPTPSACKYPRGEGTEWKGRAHQSGSGHWGLGMRARNLGKEPEWPLGQRGT